MLSETKLQALFMRLGIAYARSTEVLHNLFYYQSHSLLSMCKIWLM